MTTRLQITAAEARRFLDVMCDTGWITGGAG
jgi:hypothetical protein